jgi:A/G-specific adenine glycosylase
MNEFANAIIEWQKKFGRHDLPWQNTTDPYAIWVSEIMLQQTQVSAVIPYYTKFISHFPTIQALSYATQEQVLQHWSGLGYYSRARNLHNAAQKIVDAFNGIFPQNFDDILSLPGIGRSTAAAISTFAFNKPQPILDGNVKRVFARHFILEGWPGSPKIEQEMWKIALRENATNDAITYTQGLMDLGATVCRRSKPKCYECPLNASCKALNQNLTKQLPTPKPRKALPEKRITMLVMTDGDEVMLEKRPPSGVWGGLWSFPETEITQKDAQLLPKLTHTFTHFKLHIQPQLVLTGKKKEPNVARTIWLCLDDAINAAIPVPVRHILINLKNKEELKK